MDHLEPGRLEHELRDVLTHERRALSTELVDLDKVYAGAARRRRRRTAVVSAAAAVVLVAVAVPVSVALLDSGRGPSPIHAADSAGPTLQTPANTAGTSPASPAPSAAVATRPLGPAWDGARVLSVTATSQRTFVALGYPSACLTSTASTCLRLAETSDGGAHFTALAVPKAVPAAGSNPTTTTASDVRFGSASDGWIFGGGLWSTHDGGDSWGKQKLPGRVVRLEAASGTAWALVTDGRNSPTTYLWRTPVGSDDWTKVSNVTLGDAADLTVQASHVVVLSGYGSSAWVGDAGKFAAVSNPCTGALSSALSATASVWAKCVTGTSAQLFISGDGASWKPVVPAFLKDALPNQAVVGARSESDALLAVAPNEPFYRLRADGTGSPVKQSPTTRGATSYIGFTTRSVGYAITGKELWRTEDGGDTWNLMRIG